MRVTLAEPAMVTGSSTMAEPNTVAELVEAIVYSATNADHEIAL
jgi:hypothetical protein